MMNETGTILSTSIMWLYLVDRVFMIMLSLEMFQILIEHSWTILPYLYIFTKQWQNRTGEDVYSLPNLKVYKMNF